MTESSLTAAQIAALLQFGVGVGSEGGANPGLGLTGWVVNGQGQFDASGDAINASSIIGNSGYTVGLLQFDFGQNGSGLAFNAFLAAFFDSPQGESFSPSVRTAIRTSLLLNGQELEGAPSNMLNETQFNALNSFLLTPAGAAAYGDLDQIIINATSPTGVDAANAVANSGGDLSAQEIAAAVAMKLYNQAGSNSPELSDFNTWLQTQTGVITSDSIQDWIDDEPLSDAVWTGLSNTFQATTTLDALQASSNPTLQGIYQDLVSGSDAGASSDGLYDLGVRLLTVSSSVAATVMNAISSGTYYQGTSSGSFNSDGTLATGSHGTIVGANGDVVIWNADGTAFAIQNGVATQLSGISAIQLQGQQSIAVSMPDGSSLDLSNMTTGSNGECFLAGTKIEGADGTGKPIEQVAVGDLVLAFSTALESNLHPARVTRLFRNITSEWLVLSCGLTVTPGHRFLNERGAFERIDDLVARGGAIVRADGSFEPVTAERVVYSEATRHLYEEAEDLVAVESAGALALQPQIKRGWRTYNFEVEGLHTYIAGGVRVHNNSLGDTIIAEDDFAQINGTPFDVTNPADVQLLAQEIGSGAIDGGVLTSSIGPDGDLTALEQRLVSDDITITNAAADADGDTTFTASNGDQITLDPNRQEVSEVVPDGQGGTDTQMYGYSSNGTQVVTSEQDVDAAGQVISNVVNTTDPTTGALVSSSETDYDGAGDEIDAYTTNANNTLTSYNQFNADGSSTSYAYASGEAVSDTQYAPGGAVVAQQTFAYDSSGDLASITTDDGSGNLVSFDDYSAGDGSHLLTDYNSSGQPTDETQFASDGVTVVSAESLSYDSSGNLTEVDTTNGAGALVSTDVYHPDGSDVLTTFNASGLEASDTQYAPDGSLVQSQQFAYDSSGDLASITTDDGSGNLVSFDDYSAGDGSHLLTDYNSLGEASNDTQYAADGSVTAQQQFVYDSAGDLASISTYDGSDNLLSIQNFASDGSQTLTTFDGFGNIVSLTVTSAADQQVLYDAGQIASSLSSTIGNLLAQNGSIFDKIAADTISGDIGTVLQQFLTTSGAFSVSLVQVGAGDVSTFDAAVDQTFSDFGSSLPTSFAAGTDLGLSSVLTAEAAQALGISGFAGVAFSTIGGTITQQLIHNAEALALEAGGVSLQGYTGVTSLTQDFNFASLPTEIGGAFGSYFGSLALPPTGLDGEIGAAIGSSIGEAIGTSILPIIGTFLGSFIGDILGTLFGDLFSRPPQATDQVVLDASSGLVEATAGTSVSGASASMFYPLSDAVAGEVNQVLALAGATFTSLAVSIDYNFKHNVMMDNGVQFATDSDSQSLLQSEYEAEADIDSMELLNDGTMQSGDVVALAGLGMALVQDADAASVASDVQIAKDYETYLNNTEAVNALIAAEPNSVYAAGWAITLMRAEELGLTNDLYDAPGAAATLQTSAGGQEIIRIYSDSTLSDLEEEIDLGPNGARQDYDYFMNQTATQSNATLTTLPGETLTVLGDDDAAQTAARTTIVMEGTDDVAQVLADGVTVTASGIGDQAQVADNVSGLTMSGTPAAITLGSGDSVDATGIAAGSPTAVVATGRGSTITIDGAAIVVAAGASLVVHGAGDAITVELGGSVTTDATESSVVLAQGAEATVEGGGTQVYGAVGGQIVAFAAPQGASEATYSLGDLAGSSALFETSDADATTSDGGVDAQQTTQVVALGALAAVPNGSGEDVEVGTEAGGEVSGEAGYNVLIAGQGPDVFAVSPGFATDQIEGFRPGTDTVQIDPSLFSSYQAFVAAADDAGGSTVAVAPDGSEIILDGISLSQLSASDFSFVSAGTSSAGAPSQTSVSGPQWGDGTIEGVAGSEEIDASGWSNTIDAAGGSGVVNAGEGQATVNAGSGDVIVNLDGYNNAVTGGDGDDFISGSQGNTTISLGDGADTVIAGGAYNQITLGNGADVVQAGQGNETITLGDGQDSVDAAGFYNQIALGNGADTINAGQGDETISAGAGDDVVTASGTYNSIALGGGADTIEAGDGDETITAGSGTDTVTTGGYDNAITLGDGDDVVNAGAGNETITLGDGNNNVTASGYNNMVTVGNGDNTIAAGAGDETIAAGWGDNTIVAQGYGNNVTLGDGINTVTAGAGSDTITANGGDDSFNVSGWSDLVKLMGGAYATIYDNAGSSGGGLQIDIGSANSVVAVNGFDPQMWINLLTPDLGYSSTTQIMNALTSDGHGGTLLALAGGTGSVDLLNMTPTQLQASNFNIG